MARVTTTGKPRTSRGVKRPRGVRLRDLWHHVDYWVWRCAMCAESVRHGASYCDECDDFNHTESGGRSDTEDRRELWGVDHRASFGRGGAR